jgi:hypothetical protein
MAYKVTRNLNITSVGFWNSPSRRDGGIQEVEAAKGELSNDECDAVLAFIKGSGINMAYRGMARCRACDEMLGSCRMLTPDAAFVFPQLYEHYIVEHGVRPPQEFIDAAKKWYVQQEAPEGVDEEIKKKIDDMDYESMLRHWRNAPVGDPMFQGGYFAVMMNKKKSELPQGEHVAASKKIGWSG